LAVMDFSSLVSIYGGGPAGEKTGVNSGKLA